MCIIIYYCIIQGLRDLPDVLVVDLADLRCTIVATISLILVVYLVVAVVVVVVVAVVVVHPVSVRRFPSFRTQPLENLSHYL